MATFTTWTAAYSQLLDDMVSSDSRVGSVTVGGKTIQYRSHGDFLRLLEYAERKAKFESGDFAPRVYAKQGGRGE